MACRKITDTIENAPWPLRILGTFTTPYEGCKIAEAFTGEDSKKPEAPKVIPHQALPEMSGVKYDPKIVDSSACTKETCYPCHQTAVDPRTGKPQYECEAPKRFHENNTLLNGGCPSGYRFNPLRPAGPKGTANWITYCDPAESKSVTDRIAQTPTGGPPINNVTDPLCPPGFDCHYKDTAPERALTKVETIEYDLSKFGYTVPVLAVGGGLSAVLLYNGSTWAPWVTGIAVVGPALYTEGSNYVYENNINAKTIGIRFENIKIDAENAWNSFKYNAFDIPMYNLKQHEGTIIAVGGSVATIGVCLGMAHYDIPVEIQGYTLLGGIAASVGLGFMFGLRNSLSGLLL